MHQPMLATGVRKQLSVNGYADVRVLELDPAHGALALARRLATIPTFAVRARSRSTPVIMTISTRHADDTPEKVRWTP